MPEKILELLKTTSLTKEQIARQLELSVDEVTACLEFLRQAGFIRSEKIIPTSTGCTGNCGSCGSGCGCSGCKSSHSDCDSGSDCHTESNSGYILWEII